LGGKEDVFGDWFNLRDLFGSHLVITGTAIQGLQIVNLVSCAESLTCEIRFKILSCFLTSCSIIGCPGARCFSVLAVRSCYVLSEFAYFFVHLRMGIAIGRLVVGSCRLFLSCSPLSKSIHYVKYCVILWLPPCGEWRTSSPYLAYWVMDLAGCLLMLCYCYLTMPWSCLGTLSTVLYAFWVLESLLRGVPTRCAY